MEHGPLAVLQAAIKEVPSVKYALGVAGIAAAGALITRFLGYDKASLIILGGTFVAMILLFVFSSMVASKSEAAAVPGIILLYAVIFFFCSFLAFTVTAFAFKWPQPWAYFIGADTTPPPPPPRLTTRQIGPVSLKSGQTHDVSLDLQGPGPVDLIINSLVPELPAGQGGTPELFLNICSAEEGNSCPPGVQEGNSGSLRRELHSGPATVRIFNFKENPPVTVSATIRYPGVAHP